MSELGTLLRNGATQAEKVEIIGQWAIAHDVLIEERWKNQFGHNEKTRTRYCDLEIVVNDLKVKVAVYTAVGALLGSVIASVISATVVYALTH